MIQLQCRFGDLRLRFPVPNDPYTGEQNATSFGFACLQPDLPFPIPDALDPQTKAVLQAGFGSFSQQSEDCKSIHVDRWLFNDECENH